MKFGKIIFSILFIPFLTFGQSAADNWYFGYGAGIHFNQDGSVNALTDGQINSEEGCASISDDEGNLLFYTDGKTVYNRQHQVMVNGDNLFGHVSSTQSAIIIPKPESDSIYIVITTNAQLVESPNNGLNYHEVDMSLDNGNGAVTIKNFKLLKNVVEKIAATAIIKDCAVESIWLVAFATDQTFSWDTDTFHAFEINATGVVLPSITSTVDEIDYVGGYLKFSLDGKKLVSANMSSGLFLFDFDSNTGIVSNKQEITINAPADIYSYGVEFSPNGNYLYVHASNDNPGFTGHTASLYQYDLLSPDISLSQITLDQSRDLFRSALQLGPNGKIYRALTETYQIGTPFLGVINAPNETGLNADYEHNAVSLNGELSAQGLPVFVPSADIAFDDSPDEIVINENVSKPCLGAELSLGSTYWNGAVYKWEKDNVELIGETSNVLRIPEIEIIDAGNYKVTVFRPGAEACALEAEIEVVVEEPPVVENMKLEVCDEDDDGLAMFDFDDLGLADIENYLFFETQDDLEIGNHITMINAFPNSIPFDQTIYYSYTNESGCVANAELTLMVSPFPNLGLDEQYFICLQNDVFTLNIDNALENQNWFRIDGNVEILLSETNELEIKESGNYRVKIFGGVSEDTCSFEFDFVVVPASEFEINDVIVNGDQLEIIILEDGAYEYSLDGTTFQDSNVFSATQVLVDELIYVKDKNGCIVLENVIEKYSLGNNGVFPSFFTPNGDAINDFWQYKAPATSGVVPELKSIQIFDRYGNFIYDLDPKAVGWDGTFRSTDLPSSDYWYKALFEGGQSKRGHFSLKR